MFWIRSLYGVFSFFGIYKPKHSRTYVISLLLKLYFSGNGALKYFLSFFFGYGCKNTLGIFTTLNFIPCILGHINKVVFDGQSFPGNNIFGISEIYPRFL